MIVYFFLAIEESLTLVTPGGAQAVTCTVLVVIGPEFVALVGLRRVVHADNTERCFHLAELLIKVNIKVNTAACVSIEVGIGQEASPAGKEAGIECSLTSSDQTVGLLIEVVDVERNHAVQQATLQTDAPLLALDISQLEVLCTGGGGGGTALVTILPAVPAATGIVCTLIHIPAFEVDILIEDRICCSELQVVKERNVLLEPLLIADAPAESYRGREGITVTFS